MGSTDPFRMAYHWVNRVLIRLRNPRFVTQQAKDVREPSTEWGILQGDSRGVVDPGRVSAGLGHRIRRSWSLPGSGGWGCHLDLAARA
jgi:hypothetical protein